MILRSSCLCFLSPGYRCMSPHPTSSDCLCRVQEGQEASRSSGEAEGTRRQGHRYEWSQEGFQVAPWDGRTGDTLLSCSARLLVSRKVCRDGLALREYVSCVSGEGSRYPDSHTGVSGRIVIPKKQVQC